MSEILSAVATPSTFNELISGSVAGAAQVLVGQPLDTVKTRAQIAPSELICSHRGSTYVVVNIPTRWHVCKRAVSLVSKLLHISTPERSNGHIGTDC